MARLVYIPEIDPTTYLHLSLLVETVQFRDFSKSSTDRPEPFCPPGISRDLVGQYVSRKSWYNLPNQPKGMKDPGVASAEAIATWHKCIVKLNKKNIPPDDDRKIRCWRMMRLILAVVTAFVGLLAAIASLWKQIVTFFSG